jgi:FixJ family two-component response regulator
MPNLSGIELSERMLAIRKDIPIILCTGFGKDITLQKLQSKGIRTLLIKPLSRHTIASSIRAVLDHETHEPEQPES